MSDTLYTSERMTEIMKDFQKALQNADNFSSKALYPDYRQFWVSFRKEGSTLFGLTNYLLEGLPVKKEGDDSDKRPITDFADDLWQDDGGEG